ncbi:methyltransferase domain-containing protein [Candidatus Gottesmanbacteria bacterium]|nr:methyltransferase domain-containing protein [Candidatus Gottesmanbacteria bacterium]
MAEFSEPYKPHGNIEVAHIPPNIDVIPRDDAEIIEAAQFAYTQKPKAQTFLPEKYGKLEQRFSQLYQRQYDEGLWIDVAPLPLDYLYQQYTIKMDERLRRNGANTFGIFALSYLDGIHTMDRQDGYLGSAGWEHEMKDTYRSLLLGCSSISTADQFFRFIHAVNQNASATVTDIYPLAVKLARLGIPNQDQGKFNAVQSDAQRIPLEDGSIDFIATNFLILNLIDTMGSGRSTLQQMLKEAARVLSDEGRLVMVEQLKRNDLEAVNDMAWDAGLTLSTGGPDGGINKTSIMLGSESQLKGVLKRIPAFIDHNDIDHRTPNPNFRRKTPHDYFGGQINNTITILIYEKR